MTQPEAPSDPPQRGDEPEQPVTERAADEQQSQDGGPQQTSTAAPPGTAEEQQPQHEPQRASTAAPPGTAESEPADADAPVDWQADPATWLRGRAVLVVAIVSAVILVVTIVICLLQWFTPAMEPLQIPRVQKA